ncbi:hypothetical protein UNSWDHB_2176 [Dehalobacter sp. UNSWDHB]|nr:hypothetical protein DHBDCA_p1780 [Dehalobacter sp. DCA]AFV05791.1 hypothetical protein DCF50_p1789 [Dehalobacter sp. CF]EQB20520.1 hypothetical protein UNSWDHB_2176 [Dehalobacter sp. UNSWDHB]
MVLCIIMDYSIFFALAIANQNVTIDIMPIQMKDYHFHRKLRL